MKSYEIPQLIRICFEIIEILFSIPVGSGISAAILMWRIHTVFPALRTDGTSDLCLADLDEYLFWPIVCLAANER